MKYRYFACNLTALQPALRHCWGESLTDPMLIAAFTYFDPHWEGLATRLGHKAQLNR